MSAEKLPLAYWCPECHKVFEGVPRQEIAWDVSRTELLGRVEITFSQPFPLIVYICEDGCKFLITPTYVHAWKCGVCKSIYEDRAEAQECCP